MTERDSDIEERVTDVLERVRSSVGPAQPDDRETIPALLEHKDGDQLRDLAAEANDVVEGNEPEALLGAFDLYRLPDGDEAGSIPEAIARGDPDKVADLRTLVKLSKLSGRLDDQYRDSFESAVEDLRTTIERRSSDDSASESKRDAESDVDAASDSDTESEVDAEPEAGTESETDSNNKADSDSEPESTSEDDTPSGEPHDDSDGFSETVRSAENRVSEGAQTVGKEVQETAGKFLDDNDDEGDAKESEHDGILQDALQSAVEESLGGFGDDVREAKEYLEGIVDESETADESEPAADESTADEDSTGDNNEDVSRGRPGRQTTRYSTMSPPPSDRADMKIRTRHSTVPSRDDRSLGGK